VNVTVRLYAELARRLNDGQRIRRMELPSGSTVGDLLQTLQVPFENGLIVGLNGSLASRAAALKDGDELELLTVMEGGVGCQVSGARQGASRDTRNLTPET
jgi:sulfur carrier protein ThiS